LTVVIIHTTIFIENLMKYYTYVLSPTEMTHDDITTNYGQFTAMYLCDTAAETWLARQDDATGWKERKLEDLNLILQMPCSNVVVSLFLALKFDSWNFYNFFNDLYLFKKISPNCVLLFFFNHFGFQSILHCT